MSYLPPRPEKREDNLAQLLQERLDGDREAVQQVQALIRSLRAARLAAAWEPAPPGPGEHGPVPHS